jgi:CRISPR/Cas system-associated exonuclease Cas4 (RecB family)
MIILTHSSLSSFRACPRKYYYEYELGRIPVSDRFALAFGRVVHKALEALYKHGAEKMVEELTAYAGDIEEKDAAMASAMLKHYKKADLSIEGVEASFQMPITNPKTGRHMVGYQYAGKVDVLARDAEGKRWVIEHKTTTSDIEGFGTYWLRLAIDHQVSYYCMAHNVNSCLYDVLRKPGLRVRQNDTIDDYYNRLDEEIGSNPGKYFQQREIVKLDADLEEARHDLWQQAHALHFMRTSGFYPRNSNACQSFYGTCPYLDVCTGRSRIDDDAMFRSKEERNEELAVAP